MTRNNRRDDYVSSSIYGPFNNSPSRNRLTVNERMYVRVLTELATNRFKWVGMPESIDQRFLELTLFNQALCVFYFDKEYDRYLALRASGTGRWNMYNNPTTFTTIGNAGYKSKTLKGNDCVPIWANYLRMPDSDIVYLYATKLAKIDRTIEINLDAMRHPFVVAVEESERQTFVNMMRQVQEGEPIIFGTPSLGASLDEKIKILDMRLDRETVLNLQLSRARLWNECMSLLGINNANQDKKERLVSAEVGANDEQVMSTRGIAMVSRKIAAEQINERYGLSVSVEWNPDSVATSPSDPPFQFGGDD